MSTGTNPDLRKRIKDGRTFDPTSNGGYMRSDFKSDFKTDYKGLFPGPMVLKKTKWFTNCGLIGFRFVF